MIPILRSCRLACAAMVVPMLVVAAREARSAWDTPSWSPDGNRITFATSRDAEFEEGPAGEVRYIYEDTVYVCDLSERESEPVRLADGRAPLWSPKGDVIAFLKRTRQDGSERTELWAVTVGRGQSARPMVSKQEVTLLYSWSPDGARLLVGAPAPFNFPGVGGTYDGYRGHALDAGTGSTTPVGPDLLMCNGAAWSPDGTQVAIAGWQMAEGNKKVHSLVVAPASGGSATTIMRDVETEGQFSLILGPTWDPKGRWIAVTVMERAVREQPGGSLPVEAATALSIVLVSSDGTVRKTVYREALEWAEAFEYSNAAFSPDGKRLLYRLKGHLYVVDVDAVASGSGSRVEVPLYGKLPEGRVLGTPVWYPTGSAAAMTLLTPQAWEVWMFQPHGGEARRIARVPRPR